MPAFPFIGRPRQPPPGQSPGRFNPFLFVRRVIVFGFALIQLVLVLRILIDLGVIPAEGGFGAWVIP